MKKLLFINLFIFLFIVGSGTSLSGDEAKKEENLPEIGRIYKYSKADWYVRGAGDKVFKYTATGESLCVITIGIPGAIVKVPEKGAVVKIDPEVPMIYIDNKSDQGLLSNSYFMKKAKGKVFILLEYKRD